MPTLDEVVTRPPVATPPEATARIEEVGNALPTIDGLAWFNRLYTQLGEAVVEALGDGTFERPGFIADIHVNFTNYYLEVVRRSVQDRGTVPKAWDPLFDGRGRDDIAPIQFALCGMNAHINHDLTVVLAEMHDAADDYPNLDSAEYRDFVLMNEVLAETQEKVKVWLATGFAHLLDRTFGDVDDVVSAWNIAKARDFAWLNGNALWFIRGVPVLAAGMEGTIDRVVGFAGRGLLVPTAID